MPYSVLSSNRETRCRITIELFSPCLTQYLLPLGVVLAEAGDVGEWWITGYLFGTADGQVMAWWMDVKKVE